MSLWLLISMISNRGEKDKEEIISKMLNEDTANIFRNESNDLIRSDLRDSMDGMSARDGGSAGPLYGQTRSSSSDGRCCIGIIIAIIIIVVIIWVYNQFF